MATAVEGAPQPLTGSKLVLTGFMLALANFMVVLDLTIANVSVPHIAGGLAVSPSQGTWVITSYAVAEAICVPLSGWLAQRFGPARVFTVAMLMFAFWSAMCGLADSLGMLVVCRILQGFSGGPMIPLSQTLLLRVFPKEKQSAAIGLWAMTTVVAPIAGPVLGGTICDLYGWEWIFYINVPIAVPCALAVWAAIGSTDDQPVKRRVDVIGLGLLIVWVGAMQIMLDKGKELDWFASPVIVTLAIIAAIGFLVFLIWELTEAEPIVNLRVFRHRGFAIGSWTVSLGFGAYFASIVLIPLWLQTNEGYTATWAGYAMAFNGMLAVVFSPIVARLTTKFDSRRLVAFGLCMVTTISLWRMAGFNTGVTFWDVAMPNLIQGIAVPFFFVPLTGLILSSVDPEETASAAGLSNFMRTTAGAFATSLVTTGWEDATEDARTQLAGLVQDGASLVDRLSASGMTALQATRHLDLLVNAQAVQIATNRMFGYSAAVLLLGAIAISLAPKPKRVVQPGGGH